MLGPSELNGVIPFRVGIELIWSTEGEAGVFQLNIIFPRGQLSSHSCRAEAAPRLSLVTRLGEVRVGHTTRRLLNA